MPRNPPATRRTTYPALLLPVPLNMSSASPYSFFKAVTKVWRGAQDFNIGEKLPRLPPDQVGIRKGKPLCKSSKKN